MSCVRIMYQWATLHNIRQSAIPVHCVTACGLIPSNMILAKSYLIVQLDSWVGTTVCVLLSYTVYIKYTYPTQMHVRTNFAASNAYILVSNYLILISRVGRIWQMQWSIGSTTTSLVWYLSFGVPTLKRRDPSSTRRNTVCSSRPTPPPSQQAGGSLAAITLSKLTSICRRRERSPSTGTTCQSPQQETDF